MRCLLPSFAFLAMFTAGQAVADEVSYSLLKIHALEQKTEGGLERDTGIHVEGSIGLNEQFFIASTYQQVDDSDDDDVSTQQISLGLGLHNEVKRLQRASIATLIGYRQGELDLGDEELDDDGVYIRVQLRSHHYKNVEVRGHMEYIDWDMSSSGFSGGLGLSYFFVKGFALEIDFAEVGITQNYSAGVAYHF